MRHHACRSSGSGSCNSSSSSSSGGGEEENRQNFNSANPAQHQINNNDGHGAFNLKHLRYGCFVQMEG